MILSSLLLTTLAAASAVFAAPAPNNNRDARDISRWSLKNSQSLPRLAPQIIDTGLSELKNARRETNAQRIARGLPPLKPRKLFDSGTKAAAALKPRVSITPKSTILLYDANGRSGGNLLGYWSAKFKLNAGDYTGCYYLTTTCSDSITNPTWSSDYYLNNP
ncbi:hypothetical protein FRC00_006043, partial [Tulasnella sp. 408]